MGMSEENREKDRRNIWNNYDWEFVQIVRHKTTDPGNSVNIKQDKYKTNKQKTKNTPKL